ncbi:hypothetical protein ElyMa_005538300 [Elysia marginata]|uniref:Uncharacterized protein n=1 Tax=Elysia marginata TaxID=1093978 RepID=A0AAV4EYB9_9GAST|nr:hypothetical protein ElyMa_005538300 [Elysia marginata]
MHTVFTNEPSSLCCRNGKVDLHPFPKPPPELESLLSGDSALSTYFLDNSTSLKLLFSMTSMGYRDGNLNGLTGISSNWFSPSYFSKSALVPTIYFMDGGEAVQRRKSLFEGLEYSILADMQDMLHQQSRYISEKRCAYEFAHNCYGSHVIVISDNARLLKITKGDSMHQPE